MGCLQRVSGVSPSARVASTTQITKIIWEIKPASAIRKYEGVKVFLCALCVLCGLIFPGE
jgi:hypothetical protein